jgi:hypothetical protein
MHYLARWRLQVAAQRLSTSHYSAARSGLCQAANGSADGSEALQADAVETWVCSYFSLALLAGVGLHAAFGWWWGCGRALAMMPVILWQGWETLGEVREEAEEATIGES